MFRFQFEGFWHAPRHRSAWRWPDDRREGQMNMKRWFVFWALVLVSSAGCAAALKDLKPALSAKDSGTIWFASAGSLVRSADGSRFTPGDPVVISGELRFPPWEQGRRFKSNLSTPLLLTKRMGPRYLGIDWTPLFG